MTTPALRPERVGAFRLGLAIALVLVAVIAGLLAGSLDLPAAGVIGGLLDRLPGISIDHGLTDIQLRVLFDIRFPRVLLGGLVGAILAVAGAGYQGVFRNPLADPYLLGIAAGSGLGATVAIGAGWPAGVIAPLAFLGGLAAVAITFALSRTVGGRTTTSLILAGVAVAAFGTAFQTFLLQRNYDTLREVYGWILGSLGTVGWAEVATLAAYAAVSSIVLVMLRRFLDVLALGDEESSALGVDVARIRGLVIVVATLGTAAAVSVSGLIGFVGIIVPHAVRLLAGSSYRVIIPLAVFYGAAFLIMADLAARTIAAPSELPIGVVTAFLGAPFFLLVLRSVRGSS